VGVEASLFYACHGESYVALPHARDHKRLGDDDTGPNTGGMGAISPNPLITDGLLARVAAEVVEPTLGALARRGEPFVGFLFLGLMLTADGPKLLEYNVRLGDPETQAILPRLGDGDFAALCAATAGGALGGLTLRTRPEATCAVVLAAAGYPGTPRKGDVITVGAGFETPSRWLIHAGTKREGDALLTAGGRVAAVVARGSDIARAREAAYAGAAGVTFDGMQRRSDIGRERAIGTT
jgi:phosphoribosylamine--glycine ligase